MNLTTDCFECNVSLIIAKSQDSQQQSVVASYACHLWFGWVVSWGEKIIYFEKNLVGMIPIKRTTHQCVFLLLQSHGSQSFMHSLCLTSLACTKRKSYPGIEDQNLQNSHLGQKIILLTAKQAHNHVALRFEWSARNKTCFFEARSDLPWKVMMGKWRHAVPLSNFDQFENIVLFFWWVSHV